MFLVNRLFAILLLALPVAANSTARRETGQFLQPSSFVGRVGDKVKLAVSSGTIAEPAAAEWPGQGIEWLYVRVAGTQRNMHAADLRPVRVGDLPDLAKRLALVHTATNLGSGGLGVLGRLFFTLKRDRLQAEFNRAVLLRDLLQRDVRRDRGLIGGNTDLPELPLGEVPEFKASREFLEKFNAPPERPASRPPRVGDFTVPPAEIVGPPAATAQPTVNIRIGTLNARPGRGWIRRGGQAGFGTGSFNVASGGSM